MFFSTLDTQLEILAGRGGGSWLDQPPYVTDA